MGDATATGSEVAMDYTRKWERHPGTLAIHAKDCLRMTFLKCALGTEDVDENDPFVDSLQMPIAGDGAIARPKAEEADWSNWFVGEVMQLLD